MAAVRAVRAAGVHVVLATGRSAWAATEPATALGLDGPQIVMNGGAYVSPVSGELVWTRQLASDVVIDALAFARGLGSQPFLGFLEGHACQRVPAGQHAMPDFVTGSRLRRVESLAELAGLGPIRVFIPTLRSEHARTLAEATDWFGDRASIVYGDESGLEVMAPQTNKGHALRAVAAAMKLGREQVAAIGDGPNDREMLDFAGHSAALLPMPGSILVRGPILGTATQVVPSSDHDGAVEALRRFFPDLELGLARPRPMRAGSRPGHPGRRPDAPDWDDDPDPGMDLTAA